MSRSSSVPYEYEYEVGGSLPADSPTYVVRAVDNELYHALRDRQLCYVLNARQMGKSSLRVRTQNRLQEEGIACADVDLSLPSSEGVTAEQWYAGVADTLVTRFELYQDFDFVDWWSTRDWLPPAQRLGKFFEEVLLARVPGDVILFFEEIDSVLGLSFRDDFFALLRSFHEQRTTQPEFRRLTFVLVGVATPSELIRESHRSPFNIGRAIALEGFRLDEAAPALLPGLTGKFDDPETVLREILSWTGGQPFLTQKLCLLAVTAPSAPAPGEERAWVENLVQTRIVADWSSQDEPPHLRTIRDRLLGKDSERTGRLLGLYQQVLGGKEELSGGEIPESVRLRLSGLVVARDVGLQVANPIYSAVFGPEWVSERLAELRPYAPALASWLASDRTDSSRLLSGEALESARAWAAGRSLSDEDYKFLEASGDLALQAERRANQLLTQAKRAAQKRIAVGSVVLTLSIITSVFLTFFSRSQLYKAQLERAAQQEAEERLKQAEERTAALQAQAGRSETVITDLERQRSDLERSIETTRVEGEAAGYVQAIGQRPDGLPPAEVETFERIAASSEDVRLEFLRQALATEQTAERLENRFAIATQAAFGFSEENRERTLKEIVLPCLRQPKQIYHLQIICAKLGASTELTDLELTTLILDLSRRSLKLSNPEDIRSILNILASLSRSVDPSKIPAILELALDLAERAYELEATNKSAFREEILNDIEDIAARLHPSAQESALNHVISAYLRTPRTNLPKNSDTDYQFWAEVLEELPGSLPDSLQQKLFGVAENSNNPGVPLVILAKKIPPQSAPKTFLQVVEIASRTGVALEAYYPDILDDLARKMDPGPSGQVLLSLVSRTVHDNCPTNQWTFRESVTAAAKRADTQSQAKALEILANRLEANLAESLPQDDKHTYFVACWIRSLDFVPLRLHPIQAKSILNRLRGQGISIHSSVMLTLLGKVPLEAAETELMTLFNDSDLPLPHELLRKLSQCSGHLTLAASQLLLTRIPEISKDLELLRLISPKLDQSVVKHIAQPYQEITRELLWDQYLDGDDPPRYYGLRTRGARAREDYDDYRYDLNARVEMLAALSGTSFTPSDFYIDWRDLIYNFDCTSENRSAFVSAIEWTDPREAPEVVELILRQIEKAKPPRLGCLLAGLAVQRANLQADQIQRALQGLISAGLAPSNSTELERSWVDVARKIHPPEALKYLQSLALEGQKTSVGREWFLIAWPHLAGRVLPEHSREAFATVMRASTLGSTSDEDKALAESITALPGNIPPRDLLDFLKQPQCVGALRSATLARLERETGRKFNGSLWKAVEWARTSGIDLDRPSTPASR